MDTHVNDLVRVMPGGRLYNSNSAIPGGIVSTVENKLPALPKTVDYKTRAKLPVLDKYFKDAPVGALAAFSGVVSD